MFVYIVNAQLSPCLQHRQSRRKLGVYHPQHEPVAEKSAGKHAAAAHLASAFLGVYPETHEVLTLVHKTGLTVVTSTKLPLLDVSYRSFLATMFTSTSVLDHFSKYVL